MSPYGKLDCTICPIKSVAVDCKASDCKTCILENKGHLIQTNTSKNRVKNVY